MLRKIFNLFKRKRETKEQVKDQSTDKVEPTVLSTATFPQGNIDVSTIQSLLNQIPPEVKKLVFAIQECLERGERVISINTLQRKTNLKYGTLLTILRRYEEFGLLKIEGDKVILKV